MLDKRRAMRLNTDMETQSTTFPLSPRENSDTMFWLRGTRDLLGEAYFVSVSGSEVWLWRSNRPYSVNDKIARVPSIHLTLNDLMTALESEGC